MKQYLHIIKNELPFVTEEDLYIPIKHTSIDSLDNVVIRVALEKHFGIEVSDVTWYQYQTLAEALEYFHAHGKPIEASNRLVTTLSKNDIVEIGMPQMANSALSDSWLLKYFGNIHWEMLSEGFNTKSSEFSDENGNRLYATFVRINYSTASLGNFKENEVIEFNAKIEGYGESTYLSNILGTCNGKEIVANLLTIFSIRANDNNNEIHKGNSELISDTICQLAGVPIVLNEYRLLRKSLVDSVSSIYGDFPVTEEIIFTCHYDLNPFHDINGVGLLYFAAYPIISDFCLLNYMKDKVGTSGHTVYRDIFYFANCNSDDIIIFQLNYFEIQGNIVKTLTSLFRQSDTKIIAKILTVKQFV